MGSPELVARLLKDGGRLLLVGGEVTDLPRQYHEHPQIILWDDNKQGFEHKEVPSNVRVIMWNRWVSHSTRDKLNVAAAGLRAIKFPNLRSREIKELLSEIVQADPIELPAEEVEREITKEVESETTGKERGAKVVKKPMAKLGSLQTFIGKHLDINADYTVKGSIKKEADRLFVIAQKEGQQTTINSLANAIGIVVKNMGKKKSERGPRITESSKLPPPQKQADGEDDFEQLDHLIQDAIAAMRLVQEHLPKVRKETERLRGMRRKVMAIFEK